MNSRRSLRPDLAECVLEDRILAAVTPGVARPAVTQLIVPVMLTTSGFVIVSTASLFSSSFAMGAGAGPGGANDGMNMASGFYITGTGAMSVVMIGNSSGDPSLAPGAQASAGSGNGASANAGSLLIAGSGSDQPGGVPVVPTNPAGQSLAPNHGSGFLYIVPAVGPAAAPGAAARVNPNQPLRPGAPVAPLAPMDPLVPVAPTPSPVAPSDSSAGLEVSHTRQRGPGNS